MVYRLFLFVLLSSVLILHTGDCFAPIPSSPTGKTTATTITTTTNRLYPASDSSLPSSSLRSSFSSRPSSMTLPSFPHRRLSPVLYNNAPFVQSSAIFGGANLFGFVISMLTGSHVHLDLIGTGAFALAAIPPLVSSSVPRVQYSSGAMALWGTKLASFLFYRALQTGHDMRLEDTLSTTSGTCESTVPFPLLAVDYSVGLFFTPRNLWVYVDLVVLTLSF